MNLEKVKKYNKNTTKKNIKGIIIMQNPICFCPEWYTFSSAFSIFVKRKKKKKPTKSIFFLSF